MPATALWSLLEDELIAEIVLHAEPEVQATIGRLDLRSRQASGAPTNKFQLHACCK